METKGKNNMSFCKISSCKIAYRMYGDGQIIVVIEPALGSCSGEWWHIAERLSDRYRVLVYDRPGYGQSSVSKLPRTPENIARELHELLNKLNLLHNIIFIGHSQGGLYSQQYARIYRDSLIGMILIDPLTAEDNRFKKELSDRVYKGSGVDKLGGLKLGYCLSLLRITSLLKSQLIKSPPFYYYDSFSDEAKAYIMDSLVSTRHYSTEMDEYNKAHEEQYISHLKTKGDFPNIPLHIIYHTPEIMINEIIEYGGLTRKEAEEVEKLWQEITKGYLSFTGSSKFIKSNNSSHYVHLTEFNLIENSLSEIVSRQQLFLQNRVLY